MGYSKQDLLNRLQDLQISFGKYDHPVAVNIEDQAKFVGHLKGALSKNLFFKDKKHRYYIVSALPHTNVDLKVLSQRLGLGKGGLRMAPEEALGEILQVVSIGCVTPFALVNESARHVSLLLDQGFKNQECCFFHPLSNDTSISLSSIDLDKFLNSIGKTPAYIDLEAKPSVGKDHPPDIASLVPSDGLVLPNLTQKTVPGNQDLASQKPAGANAKAVKPSSSGTQKDKSVNAVKTSSALTDPSTFIEEILEKTSSIVLSQVKEENIQQHGEDLGAIVLDRVRRQLSMEFKNMATIFKNTAYTEGFHAGMHQQLKRL